MSAVDNAAYSHLALNTSAHLEQGVEEYLCQRLWHSKMAVTGADLKGGLQTLNGNCRDRNSESELDSFVLNETRHRAASHRTL